MNRFYFCHGSLALFFVFFTQVVLADLIVTEVHYNPDGPDDVEFIEFKNNGTDFLDLRGYELVQTGPVGSEDGVVFAFAGSVVEGLAPGALVLVVKNNLAFRTRYPGLTTQTAGQWRDGDGTETSLGKSEEITVEANGHVVLQFTYDNDVPWPPLADGYDFTLVSRDPNSNPDPDEPESWRHSFARGGSPGQDDPEPVFTEVVINEVLTSTGLAANDSIEIFNPNASAVDIGGWFLTDDAGTGDLEDPLVNENIFQIPSPTVIPAGGYVVFTEDEFGVVNAGTIVESGFRLSSNGEDVFIFEANGGVLSGYHNGFEFQGADLGVSFGRIITSDGREYFPSQSENSFGAANIGPRAPTVVISEILYNNIPEGSTTPSAFIDEFVEIVNTSSEPVDLFETGNPNNPWKVAGVGFNFPNGTSLPGNGMLLIVFEDPATFRISNNVSDDVQIFQATGSLRGRGERVAIERSLPLVPDGDGGFISVYVVEDEVTYNDKNPWPSLAVDQLYSIVRTDLTAYGNEPANWRDSVETGGSPGRMTIYTGPEIYVNEALTHTDDPQVDVVELFNPNDTPVDISGWYLTDDFSTPKKFRFPTGSIISENGFFAVNGDNDFNEFNNGSLPEGYFGSSFSLSSRGDSLYLFSADSEGNVTGFFHGFEFDGSTNGVSFGRYIDSVGQEHFPAQSAISLEVNRFVPNPDGFANVGPLVGPVVINEIFYDPDGDNPEFIELLNITDATVNLYDDNPVGNPGNNWIISGVSGMDSADYILPGNRPTIGPNALLIILPVNTDVAQFRVDNSVPEEVAIIGGTDGFHGSLSNGGERIKLQYPDKPDIVDSEIVIPYITVDTVRYDDEAPWPVVGDDVGRSIERLIAGEFGDDPANWRISPGLGGSPGVNTLDAFDIWLEGEFTQLELADDNISGPNADPDKDGLVNLIEFALGLSPKAADRNRLFQVSEEGGFLTLRYDRLKAATIDLEFIVEVAGNLDDSWQSGSGDVEETIVADDEIKQTVEAKDKVSTGAAERRFMRLRVVK